MRALLSRITTADCVALSIFALVVFGLLVSAGHLTTGPRMTDDNQIYKLQIELSEAGFWQVLEGELTSRFEMRRLVPLYNLQKVVLATVFGGDLVAWSTWAGIVGVLTAGLLFCALRLLQASVFESFACALITLLGQQSILWWRLLHGEGIGMLFLAAALVAMALRLRTGRFAYEIAFIGAAALSALSKESFLLTLPALVLLKILLTLSWRGLGLWSALRYNLPSIVCLAALCLVEVAIVKLLFKTTQFAYTGWVGFQLQALIRTVYQYLSLTSLWLLPALVLLLVWVTATRRSFPGAGDGESEGDSIPFLGRGWVVAVLFWVALTVPQILIYKSSGLLNTERQADFSRYILPCILGYGFLIAQLLRLIRRRGDGIGAARVLAIACVLGYLAIRGNVAYYACQEFAGFSKANDAWFETVVEKTREDSPIVLVYLNRVGEGGWGGQSTQAALRVFYILSERHQRKNLYFRPIPPRPTIEQARQMSHQADTRHHGQRLVPVEQLPEGQEAEAVLILNWAEVYEHQGPTATREVLEKYILTRDWPWFDPENFARVPHPHGHVSYFRTGT